MTPNKTPLEGTGLFWGLRQKDLTCVTTFMTLVNNFLIYFCHIKCVYGSFTYLYSIIVKFKWYHIYVKSLQCFICMSIISLLVWLWKKPALSVSLKATARKITSFINFLFSWIAMQLIFDTTTFHIWNRNSFAIIITKFPLPPLFFLNCFQFSFFPVGKIWWFPPIFNQRQLICSEKSLPLKCIVKSYSALPKW